MIKYIVLISGLITFLSCKKMEQVDLIVRNAKVYTVDEKFSVEEAFAIRNGRIVEVGSEAHILSGYHSESILDAKGKAVFPGFIDPHCHYYGYGLFKPKADLRTARSFEEIIEILKAYDEKYNTEWLVGRGWDQNDWEVKEFPDKKQLDLLFPNKPVILYRVDGHAVLVNTEAFNRAGIDTVRYREYIQYKNGAFTGILIDNAADIAKDAISEPTGEEKKQALLWAQDDCFAVGLTTVSDAGLDQDIIQSIMALNEEQKLKMRIYAMLNPTDENVNFIKSNGIFKTDHLHVRSLKLYVDGALGSRGACMIEAYEDDPGNRGFILHDRAYYEKYCKVAYDHNYQVCSHAIGDSANRFVLNLYAGFLKKGNDNRWRIEHAQVVHPDDFELFREWGIIPSVQSTHATSDMYWAGDRIGTRIKYAYAYKSLMKQNGWIPNGSDFPVEDINPLYGFYAAVTRKDQKGFPPEGFQIENALNREEALKAMTIWAAKSNFEEKEKGSIEAGKFADFVILDQDIMTIDEELIYQVKVIATYLAGEKVFSAKNVE